MSDQLIERGDGGLPNSHLDHIAFLWLNVGTYKEGREVEGRIVSAYTHNVHSSENDLASDAVMYQD